MNDALVIRLEGEYDVYRCEELERTLAPALERPLVIVDFSATRYIDSSCLAMLVRMRKTRAAKGFKPSVMVKGPPQVQRILSVTRLEDLWRQCDTIEEAQAAIEELRRS